MIIINEIKKKKEFSEIPDSVVKKILNIKGIRGLEEERKVKKARAMLRRIFTSVLTQKILKGKVRDEKILKKHYARAFLQP